MNWAEEKGSKPFVCVYGELRVEFDSGSVVSATRKAIWTDLALAAFAGGERAYVGDAQSYGATRKRISAGKADFERLGIAFKVFCASRPSTRSEPGCYVSFSSPVHTDSALIEQFMRTPSQTTREQILNAQKRVQLGLCAELKTAAAPSWVCEKAKAIEKGVEELSASGGIWFNILNGHEQEGATNWKETALAALEENDELTPEQVRRLSGTLSAPLSGKRTFPEKWKGSAGRPIFLLGLFLVMGLILWSLGFLGGRAPGEGSGGGAFGLTDDLAYVCDVTIPDGSAVSPGARFTKIWRIRNSGKTTWTSGYRLMFDTGDQLGAPNSIPLRTTVSPGQTLDVSVTMIAGGRPGSHKGYWVMHAPSGARFGTRLYESIIVNASITSGYQYDFWANGSDAKNNYVDWAAESFVARYGTVSKVIFNAGQNNNGNANGVFVYIYSNAAMTNRMATCFVQALNPYSSSGAKFDRPVHLTIGQTYWVQIHSGLNNAPIQIYSSNYDMYPGGHAYWHPWNGKTTSDLQADLNLRILR